MPFGPARPRLCVGLAAILLACDGQGYVVATGVPGATSGGSTATASSTPGTQSSGDTGSSSGTSGTTSGGGSTSTDPSSPSKSTCTTTDDTFANFAKDALSSNCASCHSGEWDTVAEASNAAASLRGQISGGTMPPSGKLDATVKSRLLTWLNCPTPLP